MNRTALVVGGVLLAAAVLFMPMTPAPRVPDARPLINPTPTPAPTPAPKPKKPNCPNCPQREAVEPEPAIDLLAVPSQFRPHNISSKGAGCCTFRSAEYAARWQNVPQLFGLPEWMKENGHAGGGWPGKQADMVKKISEARGMPVPGFVQYEGNDPGPFIELALKTGRLPCVTWTRAHMLVCVHLDAERGAIVDNNEPDRVQWFSRQHVLSKINTGGAWVFVLTAPPPPPPPTNGPAPVPAQTVIPPDCKCRPGPKCTGCSWGWECNCPAVAPAPAPAPDTDTEGGVEWVYEGVERYSISGRTASWKEVQDTLADDSSKLHLTFIDAAGKRNVDLEAELGKTYLVQTYKADDWAVQFGHAPGVYLQARDGRVLLHTADTQGLLEKLRRADPNYRPDKDPNGTAPALPGLPGIDLAGLKPYLPWALGLAGVAALLASRAGGAATVPAPAPPAPSPLSPLDAHALALGRQLMIQQTQPRT